MENTNKWFARSQHCSCQNSNSTTKNSNPENHSRPWKILQYTIFILLLHPLIQWFSIFHKMLHSWSCHPSPTLVCQTIIRHCKMSNTHETVVEWKRPLGATCSLSTWSDQLDTSSPSESETLWPISASSVGREISQGLEIFLTPPLHLLQFPVPGELFLFQTDHVYKLPNPVYKSSSQKHICLI